MFLLHQDLHLRSCSFFVAPSNWSTIFAIQNIASLPTSTSLTYPTICALLQESNSKLRSSQQYFPDTLPLATWPTSYLSSLRDLQSFKKNPCTKILLACTHNKRPDCTHRLDQSFTTGIPIQQHQQVALTKWNLTKWFLVETPIADVDEKIFCRIWMCNSN